MKITPDQAMQSTRLSTTPSSLTAALPHWQRLATFCLTLLLPAGLPASQAIFSTPGTYTWTNTYGVNSITVECWGGGGAGGSAIKNASGNVSGGGGGGGGAYAKGTVAVTPNAIYTFTIPAGATAPSSGFSDGQTVDGANVTFTNEFGAGVTANGGKGGQCSVQAVNKVRTGGAGGLAGNFAGGAGANGAYGTTAGYGGGGGAGASDQATGNAGSGTTAGGSTTGGDSNHAGGAGGAGKTNGSNGGGTGGTAPGGGGGGAFANTQTTQKGGNGGAGQIIINWVVSSNPAKANNADNLNLGSSWVGGTVPAATNSVQWDATVTSANTVSLGTDLAWTGINILNPAGAVTINAGNTLTISNSIDLSLATTDFTLNCNLLLGGTNVWNVGTGRTLTVGGIVSGSNPVTKQGAGVVILAGNNTYTGGTTINSGTLQIGSGGSAGSIGSTAGVANGGALFYNRSDAALNEGYVISGSGSVTMVGTGAVTLSGTNTYSGATAVSTGELDITNRAGTGSGTIYVGNTVGITATLGIQGGTFNLGANALYVGLGASAIGVVNQTGGAVSFTSGGALLVGNGAIGTYDLSGGTLTSFASSTRGVMLGVNPNANATFNLSGSGTLSLPAAELAVGRDDAGSTGCTVTYNQTGGTATVGFLSIGGQSGSTGTTATFNLTNGTFTASNFQHLVAAGSSTATLYLGGGAQVTLPAFPTPAGSANITFDFTNGYLAPFAASTSYMPAGTFANAYLTTNGVNFNVASGNNITVAQVLQDAVSGGTLTKSGNGVLSLSGANTYSGATTISAGELKFSTAGSAATAITVTGAGATCGVLVDNTGDQWVNNGNLTLNTSGVLHIDYGSTTPSTGTAPMQVNNLYPGAGLTCQIDGLQANFSSGQSYPLITWTGSGPADATAFTTLILPHHIAGNLSVTGGTLYLNVTGSSSAAEPLSWSAGNGVWNTTTVNWVDAALAPQSYTDPVDAVVFDDASGVTGSPTITLNSVLSPASVTMASTNHDYTISGAGGIAGTGPLTLDAANTRTLTLTTANTYTGNTTINGGTLQLGNGVTQGSVAGNLIDNAALVVTNNAAQTVANALSGTGTLIVQGPGALTLSTDNSSFTGTAVVNAGTLFLNNANALAGATGITLAGGTTLTPNLSGIAISAPITNGAAGTTTTITAPSVAGSGATPVPFTLSGAISGAGNVTFSGINAANAYGTINVNAAANYAGSTLITTVSGYASGPANDAEIFVNLGVDNALPTTTVLTLDGGNGAGSGRMCTLNLNGHSQTLAGLNNVPGRSLRSQQVCNTSGAAATLTVSNSSACTFSGELGYTGYSVVAANFGLTKSGSGVLTLSGNNIYANGTTINGGTLLVNSGTGAGDVTVNSGGTLGGTGIITGNVTVNNGGALTPGAPAGKLTLNGNVILNAGSTNTFAVNGSTPANTSVALGGSVSYGGLLNIVPAGSFTNGQSFALFSGAGATDPSNFGSMVVNPPVSGTSFTFTNGVLTAVVTGPSGPASLTNSYSGGVLSLAWPAGQGWRLQAQTNALSNGLSTNWSYVTDGSVGSTNITVNNTNPAVFYRLTYP